MHFSSKIKQDITLVFYIKTSGFSSKLLLELQKYFLSERIFFSQNGQFILCSINQLKILQEYLNNPSSIEASLPVILTYAIYQNKIVYRDDLKGLFSLVENNEILLAFLELIEGTQVFLRGTNILFSPCIEETVSSIGNNKIALVD